MTLSLSLLILLLILILIGYIVFRKLENAVCSEVCAIFCNTIVYIDQLCGINNDIMLSWRKLFLKRQMSGGRLYADEKKMIDEINYRKNELKKLSENNVTFSFKYSTIKSIILHKHKLTLQEIDVALALPRSFEEELIGNCDSLIDFLKTETKINSGWSFAEGILRSFQHEANSVFYAILEGLCSFPPRSLSIYEQQRYRFKFMPSEIGLDKRKEDYLQLQEMESKKAEEIIASVRDLVNEDGERVDIMGNLLFSQQINIFFAGSKSLQTERDIYSNVINQLQTRWKDKNINLYGYSFQNFEHEFVLDGHQLTYNEFIKGYADIVIFVLNGNVGGKTKEEFEIAMSSFKEHHRPLIYVYSRILDVSNEDVDSTRNMINLESQYWQDYSDNDQLRLLIKNDLSDRMQMVYESMIQKRKEILE